MDRPHRLNQSEAARSFLRVQISIAERRRTARTVKAGTAAGLMTSCAFREDQVSASGQQVCSLQTEEEANRLGGLCPPPSTSTESPQHPPHHHQKSVFLIPSSFRAESSLQRASSVQNQAD